MKQYIECLCPVCGRTMGKILLDKELSKRESGYYSIESYKRRQLYLDYLEDKWDLDKKEWAYIRDASGGRGHGFPIIDTLEEPEEAPELFEKLKSQLLRGLQWWINREWITQEEIQMYLEEQKNEKV